MAGKKERKNARAVIFVSILIFVSVYCGFYFYKTWSLRSVPDSKCVSMSAVLSLRPSVKTLVSQSPLIVDAKYHKPAEGKSAYLYVNNAIKGGEYLDKKEIDICPGYEYLTDGQSVMVFLDGLDKAALKWMPLQGDTGIAVRKSDGSYELSVADERKIYTLQDIANISKAIDK